MTSTGGPDSSGLNPGRHDAVVVDARWTSGNSASALELALTLVSGSHKGEVVDLEFPGGSPGLARALASLGVELPAGGGTDGDILTAGALGMPCTLVLVRDADGNLGYALDP